MMDSNTIVVRYVRARAWRNIFEVTPACVFNFYSYYFGRRIVDLKAAIIISRFAYFAPDADDSEDQD